MRISDWSSDVCSSDLNPDLNVVLLSATLPPAARQVLRHAYVSSGPWLEIDAGTPRYEFDVVVQSYDTSAERQAALDFVIDRAPRPMIIYTTLAVEPDSGNGNRSEEHTSQLQSLMRISYAVFCLTKKNVLNIKA